MISKKKLAKYQAKYQRKKKVVDKINIINSKMDDIDILNEYEEYKKLVDERSMLIAKKESIESSTGRVGLVERAIPRV